MDRRSKLVGLSLALASMGASAYVYPPAPAGFTAGTGGGWAFTPASPAQQLGGIIRGPGPSIAGVGQTTAAFRLAPSGAARALARGVLGGGIPGALAIGALWFAANCFEKQGGSWVRTCGGTPPPESTGVEYSPTNETGGNGATWFPTKQGACARAMPIYAASWAASVAPGWTFHTPRVEINTCYATRVSPEGVSRDDITTANVNVRASSCPAGWYITDQGCVSTPPPSTVTPQEIEDELATKPLPSTLPPGIKYPLDPSAPTIWNPTEDNPPTGRPLRVPQGDPQAIPGSDPTQYRQPFTRYTHSPTQGDPWRMDPTGEDVVGDSPTGQQVPEPVGPGSAGGTPKDPPTPDLCEKNPDIVACQKLGTLEPTPVPNENRNLAIAPETGFGPSNGTCPAAKTATVMGVSLSMPYTMLCDFALGIRPLLLAFAWLSAALTFMGLSRKD